VARPGDVDRKTFWERLGQGRFLAWLPFLVPLVYLVVIYWAEPENNMGDPVHFPKSGRLLYDDFDTTAYALRGLNATLGRTAGRLDPPPYHQADEYAEILRNDPTPADPAAPYFLEYPHAALWMFRLPYLLPPRVDPSQVPAAVADACHNDLVWHTPQNESERSLWGKFRQAIRVYNALGIACLLLLMAVLRRGYAPGNGSTAAAALLLLPATLYFSANRFDIVPALLTALSFACLGRKQTVGSAVFLGAATMIKLYPVLFTLLVLRYLGDRRKATAWAVAYGLTLAAFLLPTLWQSGWEAAAVPYLYQLTRTMEGEFLNMSSFGHGLPYRLGTDATWAKAFRTISLLAGILVTAWSKPPTLEALLRRAALVLLVFVSLQVFYSPQWIVWFTPLLLPLVRRHLPVALLFIVLDLTTYLTFPVVFDSDRQFLTPLIYLRGVIMAALFGSLAWTEFAGRTVPRLPAAVPAKNVL
jgi:Glycosyltransferase family 87